MPLPSSAVALIDAALAEDVGPGDFTTLWTVPEERRAEARIVAAGAHAQVQDVVGEGAPAVEVGGVDPEVAEGPDVAHGVSFRR